LKKILGSLVLAIKKGRGGEEGRGREGGEGVGKGRAGPKGGKDNPHQYSTQIDATD
jgi:hypothetical protein